MRAQSDKSELAERFDLGHGASRASSRAAALIAWTIVGVSVALMPFRWLLLYLTPPMPYREVLPAFFVLWEVLALTFPVVGAFVASRRPHHPIGWLLCGIGLLNIVGSFAVAYGDYAAVARPDALPAGEYMAWIADWLGVPSVFSIAAFLFLLFPDGHLPSRRWRFVGWTAVLGSVMLALGDALHPYPFTYGPPNVENPLGIGGVLGGVLPAQLLWEALSATGGTLLMASCLASVASLMLRLRRAQGDERQQLKWFVYAATLMVGGLIASFLFEALALGSWSELGNEISWMAGVLGFLLLPVFMAVAILKYRLYDIDLVINRTLVYAALTAAVLGLYVLVVGGLGALFQASGNLLISLLATGLVAVLFQPMRSRLQRWVNRLMYGERDDPYAVLSRLGQHLETAVAPEAALSTIVQTVAQALKVPYVAIELKEKGEPRREAWEYGTPADEPLILPLTHQWKEVGQMLVTPRSPGEEFSSLDKRLLMDLARQAGAAAHAARLTTDLQHSRERLVTAREEERRRLRRDLHDGLGPALGGITLGLDAARSSLPKDSYEPTRELLSELKTQTQEAVSDIRRLVHNLRPPALDNLGLLAAIGQEAANHGRVAQSSQGASSSKLGRKNGGLTFSVEDSDPLPPLPAAVEVAAYRIAQEAITNVSRHAEAESCWVVLSVDEVRSSLTLEVVDDGIGIPEDRRAGVGMSSMRERAEELGGSLAIERIPEGGTCVLARLPLPGKEKEE